MTPSELDTISQTLFPGQTKNERYACLGNLVGYSMRAVYDWYSEKRPVPEFIEKKLRAEEQKAKKRQSKKLNSTAKVH